MAGKRTLRAKDLDGCSVVDFPSRDPASGRNADDPAWDRPTSGRRVFGAVMGAIVASVVAAICSGIAIGNLLLWIEVASAAVGAVVGFVWPRLAVTLLEFLPR